MKERKPKDSPKQANKTLSARYSEVVKLRELVKKVESEFNDGKSIDQTYNSLTSR
jgi:capsular polysaccharide biosynthesis protein